MEHGVGREVRVFPDRTAATSAAARHIYERAREAVRSRGHFSWVLAGGRTPEPLYRRLARQYFGRLPWAQTWVYFGDERCVGARAKDSNYAMAREALIARVPIPRRGVHRMRGELRPPANGAREYARRLGPLPGARGAEEALFDLVLLGVGPDGHTASLFPNAPSLREGRRSVVAVRRAGQPPFVPRLTLTLPALASSREVMFLVVGAEKAEVLARIFLAGPEGDRNLPASLVRSVGRTVWFLDRPAAAGLPRTFRGPSKR